MAKLYTLPYRFVEYRCEYNVCIYICMYMHLNFDILYYYTCMHNILTGNMKVNSPTGTADAARSHLQLSSSSTLVMITNDNTATSMAPRAQKNCDKMQITLIYIHTICVNHVDGVKLYMYSITV